MENSPIDFSPVDRLGKGVRFDALVASIVDGAQKELRQRAALRSPVVAVANWSLPMVAVAAVLVTLSVTALVQYDRPTHTIATISDAIIPAPEATWLSEDRPPNKADLILAVEEETP